ncbi:10335_t:CDS:2 [Paraglomus occultum]|uniref:10335_t:CDS:1 n=1 Tax=Paraglomus occultum TaxID=144539 RepID=A0A9N9GFX2_9GLOM|nr:10335_t:CDS:2 [Paraglomus occultum]
MSVDQAGIHSRMAAWKRRFEDIVDQHPQHRPMVARDFCGMIRQVCMRTRWVMLIDDTTMVNKLGKSGLFKKETVAQHFTMKTLLVKMKNILVCKCLGNAKAREIGNQGLHDSTFCTFAAQDVSWTLTNEKTITINSSGRLAAMLDDRVFLAWGKGSFGSCYWNEYDLNLLTRNNWRASLVPAAAVIPAPIAYIKVVAVKKLVVELQAWLGGPPSGVFKAGTRLNTLAWNNGIGQWFYLLVSRTVESGDVDKMTRSAPHGKPKCLGSGGSMVARLKLKGIDGRAPPGVEPAA